MKFYVECIKNNDVNFYFFKIGNETHGRYSHKIWVSHNLLKEEIDENGVVKKFIEFPLKGKIKETEKGTKILVPTFEENKIYYILCKCGYRGVSSLKEIRGCENFIEFKVYDSPLGNLGISSGVLVEVKNKKGELVFERSGRRIVEKIACYRIDNENEVVDENFFTNSDEMEDITKIRDLIV